MARQRAIPPETFRRMNQLIKSRDTVNAVKIGQSYHRVAGLPDAVAVWEAFRDRFMENGGGSSDAPNCTACVANKLYRISWNGRVWDGATGAEVMP